MLRDSDGKEITLRGVSLFWSQWMDGFFDPRAIAWLARDWRIDIVRAPLGVADPGFLSDPAGETAKIRSVIDAAIAEDVFVLVDWHAHQAHTRKAVEFFSGIARAYGNCPNLLYESWNEPARGLEWEADIAPHHVAVIDAIRAFAPDAAVVVGTPDFCTSFEAAARVPIARDNVAYALHFYAATHRQGLRERVETALEAGLAFFASEWGFGEASGDGVLDFEEAKRWLAFLNAREISHLNWSICDKEEACAALRPGASCSGRWGRRQLSPSGAHARAYLRNPS